MIPSLKPQLLQQLLSASASAIKMSSGNYDNMGSLDQLYPINKRATPAKMLSYKHSLLLLKIYNNNIYSKEWTALNFQLSFNDQMMYQILKSEKNIAVNRLKIVNVKTNYEWSNLSWNNYKIKFKNVFL